MVPTDSIWVSAKTAFFVTILSVSVGTCAAFLFEQEDFRFTQGLYFLMLSPLVIPGVILGISIILWAMMTFPKLPEHNVAQFAEQRATIEASGPQAVGQELSSLFTISCRPSSPAFWRGSTGVGPERKPRRGRRP